MRLTVVSPYGPGGASTRIRVYDWLRHLQLDAERYEYIGAASSGATMLASRPRRVAHAERALRELAGRCTETLLLQREASPLSRGRLESVLLSKADHGVYDFDDALQWDHGRGGLSRHLAPKAPKCVAAVRAADVVVAGNDLLADWASQWCRKVVVIPSCVEPSDYLPKEDYDLHRPPRIGWLGSSSAESQILVAADGLLRAHKQTGVRLTLLSSGSRSLGHLDQMIDRVAWTPSFSAELRTWDLAIAPLFDSAITRGKCAFKILQYGAAALPIIGAPVGVNRQMLEQLGAVPAEAPDWSDHLADLLSASPTERRMLGLRARSATVAEYSFQRWRHVMVSVLGVPSG
jgi:glycosyltransferase involved in cell wall biosynthesis